MSFDDWYKTLISDEIWFEQSSKRHKLTTFLSVAEKVYTLAIADPHQFSVIPISERRRHVVYLLAKIPPDKIVKPWYQQEEEKKEEEKVKEWVPLTGEARAQKLAEFKAMVDGSAIINAVPRLTNKEIIESGQVRLPKSNGDYHRSVVEQMVIAKESKQKIRECRRKFFLDAFPDADEDEIHAYWQQFPDTKDDAI